MLRQLYRVIMSANELENGELSDEEELEYPDSANYDSDYNREYEEDVIENVVTDDEAINEKYVRGEVRIVTEQGRYQLTSIVDMIDDRVFELNPEFQRRRRWDTRKQSRLIESFIMNVPIPPIFLYEHVYSHYEVMDGLQRLTAINDFYKDKLVLEGLEQWPELNGRTYSKLPEQIKRGVDRRYISSIILLHETARDQKEAKRLKQLVFERINSGGVNLEPQESRNAVYNGPLNQICVDLARNSYLCKAWKIPEHPTIEEMKNGDILSEELMKNSVYQKMYDVELVLRFFAYEKSLRLPKQNIRRSLDAYLQEGNNFSSAQLNTLRDTFNDTIKLVYDIFGDRSFFLWRKRSGRWSWLNRPTITVYDPLMYVFKNHLNDSKQILDHKKELQNNITKFYEKNNEDFKGRSANLADLKNRNALFDSFLMEIIKD
jgi:hypothetical protein